MLQEKCIFVFAIECKNNGNWCQDKTDVDEMCTSIYDDDLKIKKKPKITYH